MKIDNRLIYVFAVALFALTVLSWFVDPKYDKGAEEGILAFSNILAFLAGMKLRDRANAAAVDAPAPVIAPVE